MQCEKCGRDSPGARGDPCLWCGAVLGGGAASGPWQTPATGPARPEVPADGPGIPWENAQTPESLFTTLRLVLFEPAKTFAGASRVEGLVQAFVYTMILSSLGQVVGLLWQWAGSSKSAELAKELPEQLKGLGPVLEAYASPSLSAVVAVPIMVAVGTFIGAAISHVCLMMVGGANGRFDDTFRATAFAGGSAAVFQVVPVVGMIITVIWGVWVEILGIRELHRTTTTKAVLAVLLPGLVLALCCCCGAAAAIGAIGKGALGGS